MSRLEIGVLVRLKESPAEEIRKVADLGLRSCQVCTWQPELYTEAVGDALLAAAQEFGVTVTTLWAGYSGPRVWNFIDGPKTIGLVPPEYRARRVAELQQAARFAARLSLPSITTHVGFIPEDPNHPDFAGTVEALRQVVEVCAEAGVEFWFETGQETPVTLLRTIEEVSKRLPPAWRRGGSRSEAQHVGTGILGINLDTGNLILYGKANPIDALDVFGPYVRGVHAKDALYPTNGSELGQEVPLGRGKVDFPAFVARLKALGYAGALTIEREISGPQQTEDIRAAIEVLKPLC